MTTPRFTLAYGKRLEPSRDWIVLLATTALLLFVSVAWNLWLFNHVAGGAVLGAPASPATTALDEAAIKELGEIFAERAREATSYRNGTYRFIDPSR